MDYSKLKKNELIEKLEQKDKELENSLQEKENLQKEIQIIGGSPNPTIEEKEQPLAVVFPCTKGVAESKDLELAIRSWQLNFDEEIQVIVVGDKEDWYPEDLLHIPHKHHEDPRLDLVEKLKLICENEIVPEQFVLANQSAYMINYCSLADIDSLKCKGQIKDAIEADYLKELMLTTYDYETQLPFLLNKHEVAQDLEAVDLTKSSFINAFVNDVVDKLPFELDFKTDNQKCGVYRSNPNQSLIRQATTTKKWITNSEDGWCDALIEVLNEIFPPECPKQ